MSEEIIKDIRAGMSKATIQAQHDISDAEYEEALESFKEQKALRDQARNMQALVPTDSTTSELSATLSKLAGPTPESMANEIALLTQAVVSKARTELANAKEIDNPIDPMELAIFVGVAEKASKIMETLYGEGESSVETFDDFSKRLTF